MCAYLWILYSTSEALASSGQWEKPLTSPSDSTEPCLWKTPGKLSPVVWSVAFYNPISQTKLCAQKLELKNKHTSPRTPSSQSSFVRSNISHHFSLNLHIGARASKSDVLCSKLDEAFPTERLWVASGRTFGRSSVEQLLCSQREKIK